MGDQLCLIRGSNPLTLLTNPALTIVRPFSAKKSRIIIKLETKAMRFVAVGGRFAVAAAAYAMHAEARSRSQLNVPICR